MKELIEKWLVLTLGAARITRKKAEQMVNAFVKKGVISRREAKDIIKKIMSEAKKVEKILKEEGKKELKEINSTIKSTGRKVRKEVSKGIKKARKSGMKL